MSVRKVLAMATAAAALIVGPALSGSATAGPAAAQSAYAQQARAAGLTGAQAAELQQQVDSYLAAHPDARQVSANRLATEGGTVTLPAPGDRQVRDLASPEAAVACAGGHLCVVDGRGRHYDYYRCGRYGFDGIGDGTFNNNQTTGTVARFYNSDGSLRWSNRAKDTGTASWTPVHYIQPC
ncbi:hypothetical protein AB0E75_27835 [Streptomyces griseoviridis]|uniref:Secreted protein n=3 Tax=Streptomyces TaxID=1883 RepID=A0ABT9LPX9_STRGD|nr:MULTISPECIES: hypothetical protein [Streptomyces]MDP9685591.1 hypothetical protein [Streptomyces griseoviridis]GGS31920.1 hypothetical protein GCM10010238_21270 [Streptomyces niveoruber]GGS88560.1 hypothetical protein GCM10010240_22520 [Streptomyces griseoviridis]GGU29407.1 hypothetical protein GCM10010259_19800 [Streptomyces daghestanicus]GHI34882.1 hypothetical protein Sdagh_66120 [Streptomyces daghestanicus]